MSATISELLESFGDELDIGGALDGWMNLFW
jgi:hypothetical protein